MANLAAFSLLAGFTLIILGGVMEGSFSLPLKYTPKWKWENIWGAGSLMALLLVPWPLAAATIPNLGDVYRSAPASSIWMALLFGAGWGVGGIFFGLALDAVGLSLGLSVMMGLIAINGSLIPLFLEHPEQFGQKSGLVMMCGVAVMLIGLVLCSLAGRQKERALRGSDSSASEALSNKPPFVIGLLFCVAGGVLSALVNFGLIFGTEVSARAIEQGADPAYASNAVWALVFTANYLVNVGYCAYLSLRNRTAKRFFERGTASYWLAAAMMGAVWAGGIVLYGMGAFQLGQFGAYVGFPIMLISSIVTGNVLGLLTGEWKGVGHGPLRIMGTGVGVLLLAIIILGYANGLTV